MSAASRLIQGSVHDPTGAPLPNARVWIAAGPVEVPDIANLTDDQGGFAISVPAPGRYEIAAAAAGFQTVTQEVDVPREPAAWLRVQMRPAGT